MRAWIAIALIGCSGSENNSGPADVSVEDTHVHDAASEAAEDAHDTHPETNDTGEEPPPPPVPETLAETGLYKDIATLTLADGVTPFDVKYPLWSDGADKSRWMWLPPGTSIDKTNADWWSYPKGTKAWKEFRRDGKRIETRFLEKTGEGTWGWRYVAYAWSADQKSATAARDGVKNALGTTHNIPSQEQCDQCHSGTHDGLIGPGAVQFGDKAPPGDGIVKDSLGYLHGNCGYCHSDRGRWATARPARLRILVADTDPKKTGAYVTMINVRMAHLDVAGEPYIGIVPGQPDKSHLYYRMGKRDGIWDMPPTASAIVDDVGLARIREWITGM